jgi:hypothetical protein
VDDSASDDSVYIGWGLWAIENVDQGLQAYAVALHDRTCPSLQKTSEITPKSWWLPDSTIMD